MTFSQSQPGLMTIMFYGDISVGEPVFRSVRLADSRKSPLAKDNDNHYHKSSFTHPEST